MNRELFEKVRAKILSEPEDFYMGDWESAKTRLVEGIYVPDDSSCRTTRCLAGWALSLSGQKVWVEHSTERVSARAAAVLGIPEKWTDYLFYAPFWPPDLQEAEGDTAADGARKASEIIDRVLDGRFEAWVTERSRGL